MRDRHDPTAVRATPAGERVGEPGKRSRAAQRYPRRQRPTGPRAGEERRADGDATTPGAVFARATAGTPAPVPHRATMESLFGIDLADVQAFPGRAAELSPLGARGAASGDKVAFGPRDPEPALVAHELTHVVQDRKAGGPRAGTGGGVSHPSDPAEGEARAMAARVGALAGDADAAPHERGLAREIGQTTVGAGGDGADAHEAASDEVASDEAASDEAASDEAASDEAASDEAASDEAASDDPGNGVVAGSSAEVSADDDAAGERGEEARAGVPRGADLPGQRRDAGSHGPAEPEVHAGAVDEPDATARSTSAPSPARPTNPAVPAASSAAPRASAAIAAPGTSPASAGPGARALPAIGAIGLGDLATTLRGVDEAMAADATTLRDRAVTTATARPPLASRPRESAGPVAPPSATATPVPPPRTPSTPSPSGPSGRPAGFALPAGDDAARAQASAPLSTGPRPRVELTAEASPRRVEQRGASLAGALGQAAQASEHAARTTAAPERGAPPRPPPAPPPLPVTPLAVPEPRVLESVPPAQRPAIEAQVAPALQARAADVQARIAAVQEHTAGEVAALERRAAAHRVELTAEASVARAAGQRQVEQVRTTWQAETRRVEREHARRSDEQRTRAQREVATLTTAGEREVDEHAAQAERTAAERVTSARTQADAMVSSARARAASAASTGPVMRDADAAPSLQDGGDVAAAERDADALLAEVMALVQALLGAAQDHNVGRVLALRARITALLDAADTDLGTLVTEAMAELPMIGRYYQVQIEQAMATVDRLIDHLDLAVATGSDEAIAAQADLLAASLQAQQGMLSDLSRIATYTSVDQLAADFGLTFANDTAAGWSSSDKQVAALGAVLTERAFRDSAPAGRLDGLGFGQVFSDVMGPITLNSVGGGGGAVTRYRPGADGAYGDYQIDFFRNVTGERQGGNIDVALGLDPANLDASLLHNIVHEFGHVFDSRARSHGRIDSHQAERRGAIPADAAMREGMTFGQHTPAYWNDADQTHEEFADLFLNFALGGFADNDAGQRLERWFGRELWGNTDEGAEPARDWGWADIARDRGDDSRWFNYEDRYFYGQEEYPENIASYFGITIEALCQANGVDSANQLRRGTWLRIPGIDRRIAVA